jgi:hypothetical protein
MSKQIIIIIIVTWTNERTGRKEEKRWGRDYKWREMATNGVNKCVWEKLQIFNFVNEKLKTIDVVRKIK